MQCLDGRVLGSGPASLEQGLLTKLMCTTERHQVIPFIVIMPTHLELFQKDGDQARPDWQAAH